VSLWTHHLKARIAAGVAAGVVLLCLATAPATAAPYEPNDTQETATGPLLGGLAYSAAIESLYNPDSGAPGDIDWYVFYTSGPAKLDIAYENLQQSGSCFGPEARLLDPSGNTLGFGHPARNKTDHIVYEAPAAGQFFLRVKGYHIEPCPPPDEPYRFTIQSTAGLITPPGQTAVQPVPFGKLASRLAVTSVRLRNGRLRLTGRLARGASAKRVRVTAWRSVSHKRITFRMSGRSAGPGKWVASRLLPRVLRKVRFLRYRVAYLGDARFARRTLASRIVFKSAR
jgi:hypothetical protein